MKSQTIGLLLIAVVVLVFGTYALSASTAPQQNMGSWDRPPPFQRHHNLQIAKQPTKPKYKSDLKWQGLTSVKNNQTITLPFKVKMGRSSTDETLRTTANAILTACGK